LASMMNIYNILPQLPGVDAPERTYMEQLTEAWRGSGIMRYPLITCVVIGVLVIIWKFFDILMKAGATRKILREVDELLAQRQVKEALELTRESNSPAANILHAGLERRDEGTERVMKAILPFVAVEIVVLFLVTYVPDVAMTVPRLFGFAK